MYEQRTIDRQRQSNFELLRIVAMLFIVAHHFSVHGGFEFSTDVITVNRVWVLFMASGGKLGVDIFVLISGYFLVGGSGVRTNKILKLYIQIFTYSAALWSLFLLTGLREFSVKFLVKSLFPVTFSQWWFASAYVVLSLLSPFLNKFLTNMDKKDYLKMLVLLTVCWCIIPTFSTSDYQSNNLLWFIYLYSLAGYLRLHTNTLKLSGKMCFILAFVMILLTFLSGIFMMLIGLRFPLFGEYAHYFFRQQSVLIVVDALVLFLGFAKVNIGYSRVVNTIASTTFGIYLIHEHPYMRTFLWKTVFKNASFSDSNMLIPYSIAVCFLVFLGGIFVELFRIYVVERNYMPVLSKIAAFLDIRLERFFDLPMRNV